MTPLLSKLGAGLLGILALFGGGYAIEQNLGAPSTALTYQKTLIPVSDNTFDLGTTTQSWRNLYINKTYFATTTSGCATFSSGGELYSVGVACGSGSGGDPFTHVSVWGQTTSATSTLIALTGSPYALVASSTSVFTNASSTQLTNSGNTWLTGMTSALLLTDAAGLVAEYTGIDCTNQFVRDVSALGAGTCATVGAADVSLANLTATDTTLTFSGTYTGATARTIGLNLGNANTWTALQQFNGNASSTVLSAHFLSVGATATTTIDREGDILLPSVGTLTIPALTSAILLTGSDGLIAEYAGAGCTNQVVEDISALGASTCVSIESEQLGDDDWGELTVASGVVTIDDDVILAANFANEDWGDITITTNIATVEDDSHAHTASTISGLGTDDISGLDISADTNLAVTYPIILTDDTLSYPATSTLFGTGTAGHILAWLSGVPTWAATTTYSGGLTYSAGNVTNTLTAGDGLTRNTDDFDLDIPVLVASGGTGATTLTDGGILLGSDTAAITAMSVLADGSIVVGDGTTDPVALAAFTSSTGDLKHEAGGLEFDASAITTGGLLRGASAGVMSILTVGTDGQVLTAQADETVAWEDAGAASSNWTDAGLNIYPAEPADRLSIGTTTATSLSTLTLSATSTDSTKLLSFLNDTSAEVSYITDEGLFVADSLTLTTDLSVANGGTGASTLTGLLQGNGTSAFTVVTDSTTVGQVLRVTGSNLYGWGALNLADTDAITGDLPFANLTQVSAASVLGNVTGSTADAASVATSTFFGAGTQGQVLGWDGTKTLWVATSTCAAITGSADLCDGSDDGGGGGWPFTPSTYAGVAVQSTSTPLWLTTGLPSLIATSTFATYASTTQLTVSGVVDFDTLTSALIVTGATGILAEYAGSSACTNQAVTQISALGAVTCASINGDWWSGADLAVLNGGTGLSTFGGANTVLYTTAADALASEAAFTYTASTDTLAFTFASSTSLTATGGAWLATVGGSLGVGTTSPYGKFGVQGIAGNGQPIFDVASSSAQSYFRVLSTGTTTVMGPLSATSTTYIYSTAASKGGSIIFEDSDGAGCTEVSYKNAVADVKTVICPTEI